MSCRNYDNTVYADDQALLVNTLDPAESLLYSLEQVAGVIIFNINTNKES